MCGLGKAGKKTSEQLEATENHRSAAERGHTCVPTCSPARPRRSGGARKQGAGGTHPAPSRRRPRANVLTPTPRQGWEWAPQVPNSLLPGHPHLGGGGGLPRGSSGPGSSAHTRAHSPRCAAWRDGAGVGESGGGGGSPLLTVGSAGRQQGPGQGEQEGVRGGWARCHGRGEPLGAPRAAPARLGAHVAFKVPPERACVRARPPGTAGLGRGE